jgi:hypothetical protein
MVTSNVLQDKTKQNKTKQNKIHGRDIYMWQDYWCTCPVLETTYARSIGMSWDRFVAILSILQDIHMSEEYLAIDEAVLGGDCIFFHVYMKGKLCKYSIRSLELRPKVGMLKIVCRHRDYQHWPAVILFFLKIVPEMAEKLCFILFDLAIVNAQILHMAWKIIKSSSYNFVKTLQDCSVT